MKRFLRSLFVVMLIIGLAGGIGLFKDAMLALKGNPLDLNVVVMSDFDEDKLVTGELYDMYGLIATKEVTRTTYGIKTGSTETNFYLFTSADREYYNSEDDTYEPLFIVYATANKDEIAHFDKMMDEWTKYGEAIEEWYLDENSTEADMPSAPEMTFQLEGKVCDFSESEVVQYRDEFLTDYGYDQALIDKYSAPKMIQRIDTGMSKIMFFAAVAIGIIGLVGIIALFVSGRKRSTEEFY